MKRLLSLIAVLGMAVPAFAQNPVTQYVSSDDGSIAFLVRYVGSGTSATLQVAQGGDLTFLVAAAAYTGFECPVSGALGGIIDTTNGSCDTVEEVIDTINGNCTGCSSDFRAVAIDALGTDSADDFLTAGATQVTRTDGYPVYFDTSANFAVGEGRALIPCRDDISCFLGGPPNYYLLENPFAGTQTIVNWVQGYSTYGSGTSNFYIYSVKPSNGTDTSETITTLWAEAAGATTVVKQLSQFQYVPLLGKPHEKVIVRITNSAAQTTVNLLASANQQASP